MTNYDELVMKLMLQNNGYLHIRQIDELGYDRLKAYTSIKRLGLVRVARGVYCPENMRPDKMYLVCCRNPGVILSHESSAFLHHLLLEEPETVSVTIRHGYNAKHLAEKFVIPYQVNSDRFNPGKIYMKDCYGNQVCAYDPERTICDFIREEDYLKHKYNKDIDTAISNYFSRYKDRDIEKLRNYADMFHIRQRLLVYLDKYKEEES